MGFDADTKLLKDCGVEVDVLDSGCCGLAGNFGFERGHYEVSVACAQHGLWPAVRDARPEERGFGVSVPLQAATLAGRECTWPSCSPSCSKSPPDRCRVNRIRHRTSV